VGHPAFFHLYEVMMQLRSMMTRRAALLSGGAFGFGLVLAGCGDSRPEYDTGSLEEVGLSELGALYRGVSKRNKRAPKGLKEVQTLEQGFPTAVQKVRSGDLVVLWGAELSSEGEAPNTVLAYEKAAPTAGGSVLMQDGRTIKKLSADEFKSAPKAAGG
jgi:hypothetical protein